MKQDNIQLLKQRKANKESYILHREERIKKIKQYNIKNREKILIKKRIYYALNREKIKKQMSLYAKNNRNKINSRFKIHYKKVLSKNITYKLKNRLRNRLYFILKYYKGKKPCSAITLLGCSLEQFKKYIEQKFSKGMTWSNHGKWHIDHIKPLASFDLNIPEQVKICCHYTNLQPLWAIDNIRKGKKY